jgi:hypothetical protein
LLKNQDAFNNQRSVLFNLQETNNKLTEMLRMKDDEINRYQNSLNDKQQQLNKSKLEAKKYQKLNEKFNQNQRETAEFTVLKANMEKKISDLSKDLAFFKDSSEKKDRRIRELEKSKSNVSGAFKKDDEIPTPGVKGGLVFNKQFIQENPEENTNSLNLLLKSKLQEVMKEKERLEKENKELKEQLKTGGMTYKPSSKNEIKDENKKAPVVAVAVDKPKFSPEKNNGGQSNRIAHSHANANGKILL